VVLGSEPELSGLVGYLRMRSEEPPENAPYGVPERKDSGLP
jgi:hypothetical protein